jgi:hypothetical protein
MSGAGSRVKRFKVTNEKREEGQKKCVFFINRSSLMTPSLPLGMRGRILKQSGACWHRSWTEQPPLPHLLGEAKVLASCGLPWMSEIVIE